MILEPSRIPARRERLTITLRKEVVDLLDLAVDGVEIRNRSHAIEYFLSQALVKRGTKTVILAGGEGLKMRPFTFEMPKAMIPVQGRPLLEHTISLLRKFELRDIIVSLGHLGEKIQGHFGNGSHFGVRIEYVTQQQSDMGTAAILRDAKKYVGKKAFLLLYGDVLADIQFADFIEFHHSHESIATVALASVDNPTDWGVAQLRGASVVTFTEKPKKRRGKSHLVSAGMYMFSPEIFTYIPAQKFQMSLEKDILPTLAAQGKLFGYPFDGAWYDVSTPSVYEQVIQEWKKIV